MSLLCGERSVREPEPLGHTDGRTAKNNTKKELLIINFTIIIHSNMTNKMVTLYNTVNIVTNKMNDDDNNNINI